jgi:hypothetical protein
MYAWEGLIKNTSANVYMHLWNTGDGAAEKMVEIYSPVSYSIENFRNFDVSQYTERLQYSNPYNVLSMWTSISESINLVLGSKQTYDIVIRARSDVEFDQFQFLNNHGVIIPGKPAEIYEYNGERYPGWHDMIAYGNLSSMREYANTLYSIPTIYSEGSPFFSEFFLSTHLYRTKTNVTHHNIYADIVR